MDEGSNERREKKIKEREGRKISGGKKEGLRTVWYWRSLLKHSNRRRRGNKRKGGSRGGEGRGG